MFEPTRKHFDQARKILINKGYELICTVMSGDKGSTNYGSRFYNAETKDTIWLNKDTLEEILSHEEI